MSNLRATTPLRRTRPLSLDWWSRRPWADSLTWFDTSAFVPGPVKLVADDETARLEQARRSICFTPTKGFLVGTVLGRLPRNA